LAAGVHTFIDKTVSRFWEREDQEKFKLELDAFSSKVLADVGSPFHKLEATTQDKIVSTLAQEKGDDTLFKTMRELTVSGFFSSEAGLTKVLNYNPVPGPYQGCVDYTAGTPVDSFHAGGW